MIFDHGPDSQYRAAASAQSRFVNQQRSLCVSYAQLTLNGIGHDLLSPLIWVRDNIDCVTPLIHDLWSDRMFSAGYAYGPAGSAASRAHPLLKPYDFFTEEERGLEKTLARGDMEGILAGIREYGSNELPSGWRLSVKRRFTSHDLQLTSQFLFRLAENQDFLDLVAPSIHDSWRRAKRQTKDLVPDPRIEKTFEALTEAERVVTLSNTQLDILATAASLAQWSAA